MRMRDLIVLLVHLITTILQIAQPGGLRSVIAESVLIKHQLLIVNRSRRRAPNLRVSDRVVSKNCILLTEWWNAFFTMRVLGCSDAGGFGSLFTSGSTRESSFLDSTSPTTCEFVT